MHPHLERMFAYELTADRIRHAEQHRSRSDARSGQPRFRFSLRTAFGRRLVHPAG